MARKYSKSASKKVATAMHERKQGTLKSGSSGKKVTSRKQAIAIGLSEARRAGKKVPVSYTHLTIQDRGPYVKGRIVDLSPTTAQKIGIDHDNGVAKVEVAPIAVPQPDGTSKPGSAAGEPKP